MKSFFVRVALIIFTVAMAGLRCHATEIVSVCSGNWGAVATWSSGSIPTASDTVTIQSGDTVIIESSGKHCASLRVEAGGKVFANKSTVTSLPRYIYVYGDILCNGQIGNDTVYDIIGFNLEGRYCTISGTGSFDAARIRKYANISDSTSVTIAMDIRLRIGGTAIYNNQSGTVFCITIEPGILVAIPGDGITPGNVAIDGVNGAAGSTGGGEITVSGTLRISGILYLTNSNSANPAAVAIATGGIIETASISCPNSGASGHTFTIAAGGTLKLTSGDWGPIGFTNNTYSFAVGSTVWYTGDTCQVIGNPTDYHHLILSGTGSKILETALTVSGNLSIETGAVLDMEPGTNLTISGNCSLSGPECLLLRCPANEGAPASLIINGNISGTGTVRIERWLSGYESVSDSKFHFLASPVTSQPIQPDFVNNPPDPADDFYRWDEPTGTWINSKELSGNWNTAFQPGDDRTFHPGSGYLVAYPEDQLKAFSGILNQGDTDPAISYSSGVYAGFSLVGNPYCSALDATIDTWVKNNVDNAVWVWNGEAGNYVCWNGTVGTLTDGIIPAMQGFFVHGFGPGATLTIPTSSRVHATQLFLKQEIPDVITITVSHSSGFDGIVLRLNPLATQGYDNQSDVMKFPGAVSAPQLFWLEEDKQLSVSERPPAEGTMTLPLGFQAGSEGEYTLRFEGVSTFAETKPVFLEDMGTHHRIDLRTNTSYSFHSEAGCYTNRLSLIVGNPTALNEALTNTPITITVQNDQLFVSGLKPENGPVRVFIYDMTGRCVRTTSLEASHPVIETDLPGGYYVVNLLSNSSSFIYKFWN